MCGVNGLKDKNSFTAAFRSLHPSVCEPVKHDGAESVLHIFPLSLSLSLLLLVIGFASEHG